MEVLSDGGETDIILTAFGLSHKSLCWPPLGFNPSAHFPPPQPPPAARRPDSPLNRKACPCESCHGSTGRLLSFTTASTKKRKLATPGEQSTTPSQRREGTPTPVVVHEDQHSANSPGIASATINQAGTEAPVDPPRYLPPHLHGEVLENRRPSTDYAQASSPSEAYASLTLDSHEDMTGSDQDTQSAADSTTVVRQKIDTREDQQAVIRPPPRASSPAKRPASDMEDDHDNTVANGARANSPLSTMTPAKDHDRAFRSASVDMVDVDRAQQTNSASTPSSNQESGTTATSLTGDSPAASTEKAAVLVDSDMAEAGSAPSLDEQYGEIMLLLHQPISDGQIGFIVSSRWLARVLSRTPLAKEHGPYEKEASEGSIGPVDNSFLAVEGHLNGLLDERGDKFVPLKPGLTKEDYEIVPSEAWEKIVGWYGLKKDTPIIRRYAHNTTPEGAGSENVLYELYPPIFTIKKLRNDSAGFSLESMQQNTQKAPRLLASRNGLFQDFLKEAKQQAGIDMKTKVKLWRIIENLPADDGKDGGRSGILTPATSRSGSPAAGPSTISQPLIIDVNTFTSMAEGTQREMVDVKDETNNPAYNGHLKLDTVGLGQDMVLILEEQVGGPAGGEFVSDSVRATAAKNGVSLGPAKTGYGKQLTTKSATSSRPNSPAPGPITRGRTRRDGRTRGSVGLSNLGNTCYMNSGLQCIRSVEELTVYFLSDMYKNEINSDNPLGHGGAIAKTYASLLHSIFDDTATTSFTPRNFKNTLGRFAPTFSGYGQQDSQEFLSFLVDGIHEDLNRIHKKPYVENPDSDDNTHKDPEAIRALGEKFRQNHRARNDSVAMDLFNGFYKNTMICPECSKVSITFDPYSLLTLQLPIEQTWQHVITFAPLHRHPIQIAIDIDKNASFRQLKEYIAKRFPGVNPKQLMAAEVYSHKFYKTFEDNAVISENNIQAKDEIMFYELESIPTNYPPPKKQQNKYRSMVNWNQSDDDELPSSFDSPLADRMLVPVFHRHPTKGVILWPSFVIINRDEAKDIYEIHRKVIGQVAQMTTKDIFEDRFAALGSSNDSEPVITTDEDASSTPDSNVKANSVEGDESLVDVTMTENVAEAVADDTTSTASGQQSIHPALKSGEHLPIALDELFTMKYSKSNGKEMIQTGWSSVDIHKEYFTLKSRHPSSRRSSIQSNESFQSTRSTASEQSDQAQFSHADSSFHAGSESEEELPPVESLGRQPKDFRQNRRAGKSKRARGLKTYSAKGKGVRREASEAPTDIDDGAGPDAPLIRFGEAIICDWKPDQFDSLFGGQDAKDTFRGVDTWSQLKLLPDAELDAKKAKRAARKKSGISLADCFAETAKSEVLSEENAWYCNRCKELRRADKKLEIWTLPDILVIHLKRFSAHRSFRDKIDVVVDFPIEGLELKDWVGLPEDKETVYDLFAVDNHYGGLGGGHYTAFAQNFYDGKWYEYNDSQVSTRNNPQSVITSAAYLLFYRRRSSTPLGPEPLQKLVLDWRNPTNEEASESSGQQSSTTRTSEDASRSDSPAGNGKGAHGSSPNGSSSASLARAAAGLGAGADRQRGGGLGAERTREGQALGPAMMNEDEDLPPYEEDEGIGGMGPLGGRGNLVMQQWHNPQPTWSFEPTDEIDLDAVGTPGDADSTKAAGGDSQFGDAGSEYGQESRMMEDFGDETHERSLVDVYGHPEDADLSVFATRAAAGMPSPMSAAAMGSDMEYADDSIGLGDDEDQLDEVDIVRSVEREIEPGPVMEISVPMEGSEKKTARDDDEVVEVRVG